MINDIASAKNMTIIEYFEILIYYHIQVSNDTSYDFIKFGKILEESMIIKRQIPIKHFKEIYCSLSNFSVQVQSLVYEINNTKCQVLIKNNEIEFLDVKGNMMNVNDENDKIIVVHPVKMSENDLNIWKSIMKQIDNGCPFDQLNRKFYFRYKNQKKKFF